MFYSFGARITLIGSRIVIFQRKLITSSDDFPFNFELKDEKTKKTVFSTKI
jgi:hypothetical protein